MLLADRRVAFLHLLLAAMQAAWIAPFLALAWKSTASPWGAYTVVLGGLLAWMVALEVLSRAVESPLYDTLALGMLAIVSLLLVRLVLYGGGRPWDLSWIGRSLADTARWKGGLPPVIVLVAGSILIWQRASAATSRELSFFSVGLTFRGGLLLLLLGGALLSAARGAAPLGLLWVYLALGLSAVAVSRISEKAADAQSVGRLLPLRRLVQVLAAAGGAVGVCWLASLVYTQTGILSLFRLLDPVWQHVSPVVLAILRLLARLLNPILLWLEGVLRRLMANLEPKALEINPPVLGTEEGPSPFERLPVWTFELLRDALLVVAVVVAVLALIFFLLLYLERVRKAGMRAEGEDEGQDQATFGGGILDRTLNSLRGAARLIRRFGVGRELLAAISVQNIYANLCRIARQRGNARLPSQPPDDYLPVLATAFPGEEERLGRITAAYMRVHYGDHPVTADELVTLRDDYRAVRENTT